VRSNLGGGRIARVFFGLVAGEMLLLHALVKKSPKTPKAALELARKRLQSAQKG
jgi:phage-related protein